MQFTRFKMFYSEKNKTNIPSAETTSFGTITSRTDIPLMSMEEKLKSGSCGTISCAARYMRLQCASTSAKHSFTRSATVLPRTRSSRPVCQHLHDGDDDEGMPEVS